MFHWLWFCPRKTLYKAAIVDCYNEYRACYQAVRRQIPKYHAYMDADERNLLSGEDNHIIRANSREQTLIVDEMIALIRVYCKRYPEEKIGQCPHVITYDEFPYRFRQNISRIVLLL